MSSAAPVLYLHNELADGIMLRRPLGGRRFVWALGRVGHSFELQLVCHLIDYLSLAAGRVN